jgi:hypothetical protein
LNPARAHTHTKKIFIERNRNGGLNRPPFLFVGMVTVVKKRKPVLNDVETRLAFESGVLTVKEAAAFAHVPPNRIRDLITAGDLGFQQQCKRFLVLRSDIEALLARGWRRNQTA